VAAVELPSCAPEDALAVLLSAAMALTPGPVRAISSVLDPHGVLGVK
jgi:hypothetical protein